MRYTQLRVISNDDCIQMHTLKENKECIYNSTLCTFRTDSGACKGDSGGGIVIDNKLVGVLSWGELNCASGKPDKFTRISSMTDWIQNKTYIVAV